MLQKICSLLSTLLLITLLLAAGVLILPPLAGCKNMAVLSGSMEPDIGVGAMVVARPVDEASLEVGDVITYKLTGNTLVTHRIIEMDTENKQVITKGDANEVADGAPVAFDQIVGKVLFHVPLLGYVSVYIKTPLGIAGICGALIVIIILSFLPDIMKKEEKKEDI